MLRTHAEQVSLWEAVLASHAFYIVDRRRNRCNPTRAALARKCDPKTVGAGTAWPVSDAEIARLDPDGAGFPGCEAGGDVHELGAGSALHADISPLDGGIRLILLPPSQRGPSAVCSANPGPRPDLVQRYAANKSITLSSSVRMSNRAWCASMPQVQTRLPGSRVLPACCSVCIVSKTSSTVSWQKPPDPPSETWHERPMTS